MTGPARDRFKSKRGGAGNNLDGGTGEKGIKKENFPVGMA